MCQYLFSVSSILKVTKPIVATADALQVDKGNEDEGAGGDDQHGDATVPDMFN